MAFQHNSNMLAYSIFWFLTQGWFHSSAGNIIVSQHTTHDAALVTSYLVEIIKYYLGWNNFFALSRAELGSLATIEDTLLRPGIA